MLDSEFVKANEVRKFDSELIIFDSLHGHIGSSELSQISDKLEDFLNEFKD